MDAGLELLGEVAEFVGDATNNVAEYKALRRAVEKVSRYNPEEVEFKLESELVVKQINKVYRVENDKIIYLYNDVVEALAMIPSGQYVTFRERRTVLPMLLPTRY